MLAVGYARVSTDRQAEFGVSLDAQVEKIRAIAVVQGATIADLIVDGGQSGKDLDRPGMQRLMRMVDDGAVQAVLIAKLDRLTRSVKDLATLLERFEKRKVALISVAESLDTGSASGRLVITIMTAVSQWEREAIGERTREALRHKQGRGERTGSVQYGYRLCADGVHVEPDDDEQAVLAHIRALRDDSRTLRAIAAELNEAGMRTRRGSLWRHTYIASYLGRVGSDVHGR
ncbi:MAG: recombinase family protein [Acidobacteriota bacterium]